MKNNCNDNLRAVKKGLHKKRIRSVLGVEGSGAMTDRVIATALL
jgi:hypothetical protein